MDERIDVTQIEQRPGTEFIAGEPEPALLFEKREAVLHVSEDLIEDLGGFDFGDLLGKVMRGEITLKPPPEPRHRCVFCWLLARLPGHTRCRHGYMDPGGCEWWE